MTQSNQNQTNPNKDAVTAPNKKEEQGKNPAAGNTPSTDKSSTDKR